MSFLAENADVQSAAETLSAYPSVQAPLNVVLLLGVAHILRRSSREVRQ
jgi:hypothetical protein